MFQCLCVCSNVISVSFAPKPRDPQKSLHSVVTYPGSAKPVNENMNIQWGACCWITTVVSDSVQPHRLQRTRLPHPWDSPGKNTGVGCHWGAWVSVFICIPWGNKLKLMTWPKLQLVMVWVLKLYPRLQRNPCSMGTISALNSSTCQADTPCYTSTP